MRKLGKKTKKNIASLLLMVCMVTNLFAGNYAAATAYALTPEESAWVDEARGVLQELVTDREIMAVVYMCDAYPVKTEASQESPTVTEVPSGQTVFIQDIVMDDNYQAWEYVSFYLGEQEYKGYIPRNYLACSDERFLAWEGEYGMNPGAYATYGIAEDGTARSAYADIEQFPTSYHTALKDLKDVHPNWIFVPMNTGLDWNTVITNEIGGGKSLVYKTFPEYTKEGVYDDGAWHYASEEILEYYMDPRNNLTEATIFQFEQLTYNETYHTLEALETFLDNTFMKGDKYAPGTVMTYPEIIWYIGKEDIRRVSPFHLASRIYQEQGQGTSPLISGTYPGFEGLYNHFNIRATGTTTQEVIENGLTYARNASPQWNNAYNSILGGADVITANYIRKGQDTLYLQKYNVNPNGHYALYTHQYMQNISAPASEAKTIRNLYRDANSLESPFVFKIPVFENMPETACPMPTSSNNVVLQIPEGYDNTVYLDGVPRTADTRNGRQVVSAGDTMAQTAVVYKYNESGVPTGMYVWTLDYRDGAYIETAQPELADLLTYHGFSIRITGKSGIRYKTGIATDMRQNLLTTGINGYKLVEYGTLIMNNANRDRYPMIKGGEKVLGGMSYGKDAEGNLIDKIYETVNGRYRYTSVLVGLPADQYKVEYAFRGYITLEKEGKQTTIYGPVVARSIYSLAEQVLNAGTYPQGSAADAFLRKLIADADALGQ
uniref:N-acetylglucosaminidase n=1 Tax=Acetatifactor sp. TaxID=1872090 RepID=UPI0040559DE5